MNQQFTVIVDYSPKDNEEILGIAEALGDVDCLDGSVGGHQEGFEVCFNRDAASLDEAIKSAVSAIEEAGYQVKRVEMGRESISL